MAMREQIADELNVNALEDIAGADGELVDISVKANFKSLGAKFGGAVQEIAKTIAASDANVLVKSLRTFGTAHIAGWDITLEDLIITEAPKSGWMVTSHDGESVALDLALSPTLILAGHAREVVRYIQEHRKSEGLEISDRISVAWNATPDIAEAIDNHLKHIQDEILALSMVHNQELHFEGSELGLAVVITKVL